MSLSGFHPVMQQWFASAIGTPTDVQCRAWPLIQQGKHVLVTAPTGCGKTLTAFLWPLHQLLSGAWEAGQTHVLYVSPLKALNNDIQRNLLTPLSQLRECFAQAGLSTPEIRVVTRSGDTPAQERQRMRRRPPEILITTPESLNILLTAKGYRHLLAGLKTIILDEIHAVVAGKRGTHLITAVDRLVPLAGEFQRIALSATVKPLDTVARFVGGYRQTAPETYVPRAVDIVRSPQSKSYDLRVDFPAHAREHLTEDSWWPVLVDSFRKQLHTNRATLLFANSRRLVEKVARLINEAEDAVLVYAHHGSLSKEIRLAVEQKLKNGDLHGIVATNSLELGIDIGSLDEVLLVQTPFSVASTVQRLGRAGHRVGEVSRGVLYPTYGGDFLTAAVMTRAVYEGDIEDVSPVQAPLDVLTQVILSACTTQTWNLDALFAFLRTSAPYHDLSRAQFDLVVQMLEGRYADTRIRELKPRVMIDRLENSIRARDSAAFLLFMAGGTIPDRGYYDLRLQDTQVKIGELDEEFVWERSVGETFALGNQVWRIQRITHNHVEVIPETRQLNIIPFWKADARDADYHFAAKVGDFLEWADRHLETPAFKPALLRDYHMTEPAAHELTAYLLRQREASAGSLPHRHHLLIEHFEDPNKQQDAQQVILYTFWGGKVNRPFALALSRAWQERFGQTLQTFVNNDAVLFMLPCTGDTQAFMSLLTPENVESYLIKKLEQTGTFGAHFRENAGRALLLPKQNFRKRMPLWLNRLRSKKLMQTVRRFEDFPVLLETWRSCLQDEFDLPNLKRCLEEVLTHAIQVTTVRTQQPSPFAGSLVWRQTHQHMYEDDTPLAADRVSVKRDLLQELLFTSHLRPQIPGELIRELEAKRQCHSSGYTPDHGDALMELVKDRLLIPEAEWRQLAEAVVRDGNDFRAMVLTLETKLAWIAWEPAGRFLVAREVVPRVLSLFGSATTFTLQDPDHRPLALPESETSAVGSAEHMEALESFVGQWLSFYGPMTPEHPRVTLALDSQNWRQALEDLVDSALIVRDCLTEGVEGQEICDVTNLEILLRMLRRRQQPGFQARPIEALPLFLATHQGLTRPGDSPEQLQRVLSQLFGLPLAPPLWEEVVLPSRLCPYFGVWFDGLIQEHGLVLQGHPDKKVSFTFPEDRELFPVHTDRGGPLFDLDIEPGARYSFLDLVERSTSPSGELTQQLWQAFWQGDLSVDALPMLRKAVVSRFRVSPTEKSPRPGRLSRRSGFSRWRADRPMAGNWYRLPPVEAPTDPVEAEECNRDRVRQLLNRYGILFRELLQREMPPLQWRSVFRTLRLMEFSGEVVTGHFFAGLTGLQFMSHEAFATLKRGLDDEAVFWVNACDPASLCGTGIEDLKPLLPSRLVSNHVVYQGPHVALVAQRNGKSLRCHVEPGHARLSEYLGFFKVLLERDFHPLKRIVVETINDEPALQSPYVDDLRRFGFEKNVNRLELWKRYG